jgi:hypothetical protein
MKQRIYKCLLQKYSIITDHKCRKSAEPKIVLITFDDKERETSVNVNEISSPPLPIYWPQISVEKSLEGEG